MVLVLVLGMRLTAKARIDGCEGGIVIDQMNLLSRRRRERR